MKVHNARLVISAVGPDQYPSEGLPEIALAGRSNVGKSSFINKLIDRKALARTSSNPGKTQTLNFYEINERFLFVDVPGYGYAKVSKTEREKWGHFIQEYLSSREPLLLICQLVDIRHAPSKDDVIMYDWLVHMELPVMIIATKLDKIPKGKVQKHINVIRKTMDMPAEQVVIPFSAMNGQGKIEVWSHFSQVIGS